MRNGNREIGLGMIVLFIFIVILIVVFVSLWQQSKNNTKPEPTPVSSEQQAKKLPDTIFAEAELGELNGTKIAHSGSGFSGEGFVTSFTDDADSLTINIESSSEQLYQLYVTYRASNGYKEAELYVNEAPFGKLIFIESNQFNETKGPRMMLVQGKNSITFKRGWGYYDIDQIRLEPLIADVLPEAPITLKLSNPNATAEAVELMNYMNEQAGKFILSGQQSLIHTADIEIMTGKKPAIVAFDFIEYSPTRVQYGSTSMELEQAIAWHKAGGIVSFLWHWNSPTKVPNEPGREWWRAFYTDYTDFNLAEALADKEGEDYKQLISDMDVIAEHIKVLKLNDIPVLFRPLHEAEGGWFWWGGSGPEAAKELWRLMYDRYVNVHHLDNLIWVWNSVDAEWYPGNDVVDIVSYDSYPVAGDHNAVTYQYDKLYDLTGGTKYIGMMENGSIPDPDLMEKYQANWGTFITWNDEFILDGKHNSKEFIHYVYNHPRVITLDELPRYKEKQKQSK